MTTTESICVEMDPYRRNNCCGLQWQDSVFAFGHLYTQWTLHEPRKSKQAIMEINYTPYWYSMRKIVARECFNYLPQIQLHLWNNV
jgi:hypothetical protein